MHIHEKRISNADAKLRGVYTAVFYLLVVVVMEHGIWLPWPHGFHFNTRMIYHSIVVTIQHQENKGTCNIG